MRTVRLLTLLVLTLACQEGATGPAGPAGPMGPAGATGPQGPAGATVQYQMFEGAVNSTIMSTATVNTAGIHPGVVCYLTHSSSPGVWLHLATDTYGGTACAVVQMTSTSYQGRALLTSAEVNTGYTVRIILFWRP